MYDAIDRTGAPLEALTLSTLAAGDSVVLETASGSRYRFEVAIPPDASKVRLPEGTLSSATLLPCGAVAAGSFAPSGGGVPAFATGERAVFYVWSDGAARQLLTSAVVRISCVLASAAATREVAV